MTRQTHRPMRGSRPRCLALPGLLALLLAPVPAGAATLSWDVVVDGAPVTYGSGEWNLAASPARWNNGTGNVAWTNSPVNNATFIGGVSGSTITIGSDPIIAGTITVNGAGNSILQGPLANLTAAEIKVSTVNDGKLVMNSGSSGTLSHVTALSIASGATLYVTSGVIIDSALSVTGTGNNESRGALRLDSNGKVQGALILTGNATFGSSFETGVIASSVSGAFSFTQAATSPGTIRITGDNTFSGGTTMSNGVVLAGHDHAFGTGTLTLNGGALSSDSTTARTFVNACTIGAAMTLGDPALNGRLTFSGPVNLGSGGRSIATNSDVEFSSLTAGGNLARSGPGKMVLSGSFTASSAAAGISGGTITLGVAGGTINTNGFDITVSSPFDGAGGLTKSGSGTLSLSGASTFTGPVTVSAGTLRLIPPIVLPPNLNVMPVGDSITYGYGGRDGYRSYLYSKLGSSAVGFHFVGDSTLVPAAPSNLPADQRAHAGHSSYSSVDIDHNLDGLDNATYQLYGGAERDPHGGYWLTGGHGTGRAVLFPDVVLLLAGTNDVGRLDMSGATARYRSLLTKLTTLRPDARIFAAKITPYSSEAAKVTQFNQIITNLVTEFQTAGKKVTLVDLFTGYTGGFVDGVHPTEAGYQWMAERWYAAMQSTLGSQGTTDLSHASSVTIAAGAALEGNGQTGALDVEGTLSPGMTIGSIQAGSTAISGTYRCEIGAAGADLLVVTGDLTLNAATLQVSAPAQPSLGSYEIARYTGSLSGTFTSVSGLPSGYRVVYQLDQKKIFLATGYEAWRLSSGMNAMDGAAGNDPDGDGFSNLLEFALGGAPLDATKKGVYLTGLNEVSGHALLTLVIATRAGAVFTAGPDGAMLASVGGTDYRVEAAPDLASWTLPVSEISPLLTEDLAAAPEGYEYHAFTTAGPGSGAEQGFLRLKVGQSP